MRACIVCANEHIDEVREKAKLIITSHEVLSTPLSQDGSLPVTHWFCTCSLTQEGFIKLNELRKHSSIYIGSPKRVLEEINLKIIK